MIRRAAVAWALAFTATAAAPVGALAAAPIPSSTPSTDDDAANVRVAFADDGHLGAWLVAGSPDGTRLPDEEGLSPRLGPRWRLASTSEGALNLAEALDVHVGGTIYAGGVLHVDRAGRHLLLLGSAGTVGVFLDGKRAFARDDPRPDRDDEDIVSLDLAAGDHTVVVALRRRAASGGLRARFLDDELQPPRGGWWRLPGTSADDARALAARMSVVALDRGMTAEGYQPRLRVRFPLGAPRDVSLEVHAKLVRAGSVSADEGTTRPLFDVDAGGVPVGERSTGELIVTLPRLAGEEVEDSDWTVHVDVAGRGVDLPFLPRRAVRDATARAERAMHDADATWLDPTSRDSVEHLRDRLVGFVAKGDADVAAQEEDGRELDELSSALEQQRDPYVPRGPGETGWRTGFMRRAYRSPADGKLSEFAVYVPPDFSPERTYPLIVALHGMNGRPMEMLMWLFGHDDPARDGAWEDRHPLRDLPALNAIVVAPDGHFNAMYRDIGEEDVMRVVDWAVATYPVDPSRITITGPSMGGIGTAACALHHPDRFAAAEPLCGYHSYFVRGDIAGRTLRPWEKFIAEQRSNAFWAENGMYLPLYVVHGTKDLPEENSGVLIDRYTDLNYAVKHEHPELGHNVWQTTYEDLKGALWLLPHRRPMHPRAIRFKTPGTRWADDAWVHVRELASSDAWGEVIARIDPDNVIYVSAHGVKALALDRDTELVDDAAPVDVRIDGRKVTFQAGEPIELHRDDATWTAGPALHPGLSKHGHVTGPIRDVFHDPILFVWGASDPAQARANEEVARAWARVRWGVRVDYPIMSDIEFYARGEPLANDRALFLVGNAKSNGVVRELEPDLPVRIDGDDVVLETKSGPQRIAPKDGEADRSQLGTAFIRPNPRRLDRYVVVVEGVGALGSWRSLSLPDMLPDYVVFDEDVAQAGGQLALGAGQVRAGGTFDTEWALPAPPSPPAQVAQGVYVAP